MIKGGLKNFFQNLVCIFVPMGIVYFFLILLTYSFLWGAVGSFGNMLRDVVELIGSSVEQSGAELESFFDYAFSQIDWSQDFFTVVGQIFDTDWLANTVQGFLDTIGLTTETFAEELDGVVVGFVSYLISAFSVAAVLFFVGLYVANWATSYFVRRKTAKRNFKQVVLNFILRPFISAAATLALLWVTAVLKGFALLVYVVYALLSEIISLVAAWIVYRDKSIPFRKVVNEKNLACNLAVAVIIIAIVAVVTVLLCLINLFVGVLIAVPLVLYSMNIIDVNADSYVTSLINSAPKIGD